ncbi:serine hydrolase domain-containing protein [Leifsonia kafniensis]|uniref:serine hydrolase domain-containing protein n=1 Tax=Leifsonia kafniensis TaxID=475957 RepID=UPI0031E51545
MSDRRAIGLLAVVISATLLLSGCTLAADAKTSERAEATTPFSSEITGQLEAALTGAMTQAGASGAIVGVWAPWAGAWTAAPGTTTLTGHEKLSTDMRFRIGTNTTAMTCTVLLKLVEEKRVALSDPVSKYLERVPGIDDITLGQLCQNTSGLADYTGQLGAQFVNNPTRDWPPLEVASAGMAAARTAKPGGGFTPSNTGIVLLGMALEVATHQDWDTLFQKYIFEPLNLTSTSFPGPNELSIPGSHPHGYAASLGQGGQLVCESVLDETQLSNSMAGVAGGVVSTVSDLKVWAQALAEGQLLSKKTTDAQWATIPAGANTVSWNTYGLGASQLGPLRGSDGSIPGFLSATYADPVSGLTIVVMLNNSTAGASFAKNLALQLASIAAAAPAVGSATAPTITLPWSEADTVQALASTPACPPVEAAPAG